MVKYDLKRLASGKFAANKRKLAIFLIFLSIGISISVVAVSRANANRCANTWAYNFAVNHGDLMDLHYSGPSAYVLVFQDYTQFVDATASSVGPFYGLLVVNGENYGVGLYTILPPSHIFSFYRCLSDR